jgi:hypothetical protein
MQTEKRDALSQNCDASKVLDVTETREALSQATGGGTKTTLAAGTTATVLTGLIGGNLGRASSKNKKVNTAVGAVAGTAVGIAGTAGALAATRGKARIKPTTGA